MESPVSDIGFFLLKLIISTTALGVGAMFLWMSVAIWWLE